jgi:hypothetical protein
MHNNVKKFYFGIKALSVRVVFFVKIVFGKHHFADRREGHCQFTPEWSFIDHSTP